MKANIQKFPRFKVIRGHSALIVSDRQKVNKYTTNNAARAAGVFYYLKSLTTSGTLQNYAAVVSMAAEAFKKSAPTIRTWLRLAESARYIKISNNNIYLSSYEKIAEANGIPCAFDIITCDTSALPLVFYGLEIKQNQQQQAGAIEKRLHNNRALATLLTDILQCDEKKLRSALLSAQMQGFVRRSESSGSIYQVNADNQRKETTMQAAWGYGSKTSVNDVKKALHAAGLVTVSRRAIVSTNATWTKRRYTSYEQATGERTTWFPDQIELNPRHFKG